MVKHVTKKEVLEINEAIAVLQKHVGREEFFMKIAGFGATVTTPALIFNFQNIGRGYFMMTSEIHFPAAQV